YRALPQYRPERSAIRTWLTRLVVNACNSHKRRNFLGNLLSATPRTTDGSEGEPDPFDQADSSLWGAPEPQAMMADLRRTLRDVLSRLSLEHRTVLVLHYYLDLSCPEIARTLECPEGTDYSRLHNARRL